MITEEIIKETRNCRRGRPSKNSTTAEVTKICLQLHIQTEPLFTSQKTGEPICDRHIRRIIKSIAEVAGLSRIPSPHWLRHSHATHAAKNTPIHIITKTLGHSSGKITIDNYLHVGEDEASSLNLKRYR